ncbi:Ig-like domain-containing protein [Paenibacillus sp. 1P07SE]|uniref:Ig-like domain-containing protein n=1 Tax=Paenibacillus sp. 1P07SE TaxID=3132209 RepID=UPI0039A5CA0B
MTKRDGLKMIAAWMCALLLFTGGWPSWFSSQQNVSANTIQGQASPANPDEQHDRQSATLLSPSDIPDFSGVHPRLFVPPGGLEDVKTRIFQDPDMYDEYHLIMSNENHMLAKAFRYLIHGDEADGRGAIASALLELEGLSDAVVLDRGRPFLSIYTTSPLVYDWCYDLLTEDEKDRFIQQFMRFATAPGKSPGFPIKTGSLTITGHDVEGWFWNQLLIGLAIYDEDPRMWNGALSFFFAQHQTVRDWFYGSGLHHQGWYIGTRHAHASNFNLLMRQLTDKDAFDAAAEDVPYQLLYHLRPDGEQLRTADVAGDTSGREEFRVSVLDNTANLYENEYMKYAKRYFSTRDAVFEAILDILTRPAGLGERPLDTLPLVRYFPEPVGAEMTARSGWEIGGPASDDYLVQMRIGQYWFGNHQHMDMGTFQIYYKGNLTGDSGAYRGSNTGANSQHDLHYYRLPIAHNSLIIYNPNQVDGALPYDPKNDGGIGFPRQSGESQPRNLAQLVDPRNTYAVADVLAQGTDEADGEYRYAYISGDLTKGFIHPYDTDNPDRAEQVTRSMVTMPTEEADHPLAFFVFDRIRALDAAYDKKFVMHVAEDPVISGNRVQTAAPRSQLGYNGQLVSWSLLPENPSFDVVEGYKTGYGENEREYDPGVPEGGDTFESMIYRLEVSDSEPGLDHYFLHAMTVSEDGTPVTVEPELIQLGEHRVGARLFNKTVLFSKDGSLSTRVDVELEGDGIQGVLVTDLAEGAYYIDRTDLPSGANLDYQTVDSTCKCIYFEGAAGSYTVTRTSAEAEDAQHWIETSEGDTTPPTVQLAAPADGQTISGTVELTALAEDNAGVAGVQFFLNNKRLGPEQPGGSASYSWDTSTVSDGTYTLSVRARDEAGHTASGEPVTVIVHNEAGFLPLREHFTSDAGRFEVYSGVWDVIDGVYRLSAGESGTDSLSIHERPFDEDYRLAVEASVKSITNGEREFSLLFDVQDENNYYAYRLSENREISGIYKVVEGQSTRILALNSQVIPGATYRLSVSRIGGSADIYLNDRFMGQIVDDAFAGGRLGLAGRATNVHFDRLTVDPLQDQSPVDVTPPAVAVIAPSAEETLSGAFEFRAEATDNDAVSSVQFRINGIHTGSPVTQAAENDTYVYTWDSTTRVDGTYELRAVATDRTGNQSVSAPVLFTVDNGSGAVLIQEDFSEGAGNFEEIAGGIWSVVNGRYVLDSPDNVLPHGNMSVHTTELDGSYMINVDAGNTTAGGFRDFSVLLEYQDPQNYYYVSLSQNINPDPQNNGIFRYQNGVLTELADITKQVMGGMMHNITIRRNGLEIGAYVNGELVAVATDSTFRGGRVGLGSRNDPSIFDNLIVIQSDFSIDDNLPPDVSVSVPGDGDTVQHRVNVTADATDNVAVASVQFYLDGQPLGPVDTLAPYEAEWDTRTLPDGTYSLEAVAIDVNGNEGRSQPVLVTVDNSDPASFPLIAEYFTYDADRFNLVAGGAWNVYNGRYELRNPVRNGGNEPNFNINLHQTLLEPDYTLAVEGRTTASGNGFRDFTIYFDYQDEDNHYYVNFTENASSSGVFKYEDGVLTKLTATTAANVSQTMHQVEIVRSGDLITVFWNGQQVAQAADGTFQGGYVGLGTLNDQVEFDNLIVTKGE